MRGKKMNELFYAQSHSHTYLDTWKHKHIPTYTHKQTMIFTYTKKPFHCSLNSLLSDLFPLQDFQGIICSYCLLSSSVNSEVSH